MRFWIGVASKNHVKIGANGGFCQLCHGKAAPLRKMAAGDFIIYYSPKEMMEGKEPCQSFTAIGRLKDNTTYQVEMFEGFFPYRRDVAFFNSLETPIHTLIPNLRFIQDKKRWGYPFRYGHLEICEEDFLLIAQSMLSRDDFELIKESICRQ